MVIVFQLLAGPRIFSVLGPHPRRPARGCHSPPCGARGLALLGRQIKNPPALSRPAGCEGVSIWKLLPNHRAETTNLGVRFVQTPVVIVVVPITFLRVGIRVKVY